jgi:hypothetical protein
LKSLIAVRVAEPSVQQVQEDPPYSLIMILLRITLWLASTPTEGWSSSEPSMVAYIKSRNQGSDESGKKITAAKNPDAIFIKKMVRNELFHKVIFIDKESDMNYGTALQKYCSKSQCIPVGLQRAWWRDRKDYIRTLLNKRRSSATTNIRTEIMCKSPSEGKQRLLL